MSLLSYKQLKNVVQQHYITNVHEDQINSASIDLTLGPNVLVEREHPEARTLILRDRTPLFTGPHNLEQDGPITLTPGQFILAQSAQVFNLPAWFSAEYKLKSSMARIGLEHLNAGWCDAGWNGSVLTLELKNMTQHHNIVLHAGDRIGQVVFFRHPAVPQDRTYAKRGRYNGDRTVSGIKP